MSLRGHVRIFCLATLAWAAFWVAGLPSYYLQYSNAAMLVVSVILVPPIVALSYVLLRRAARDVRLTYAAWIAFYFSGPLALYDWLYCGLHLGYGLSFLRVFWYLTLFYVVPWAVLPATAVVLNRRDRQTTNLAGA